MGLIEEVLHYRPKPKIRTHPSKKISKIKKPLIIPPKHPPKSPVKPGTP
jgi:hypothetical protein